MITISSADPIIAARTMTLLRRLRLLTGNAHMLSEFRPRVLNRQNSWPPAFAAISPEFAINPGALSSGTRAPGPPLHDSGEKLAKHEARAIRHSVGGALVEGLGRRRIDQRPDSKSPSRAA
jgi:hypothetical protein